MVVGPIVADAVGIPTAVGVGGMGVLPTVGTGVRVGGGRLVDVGVPGGGMVRVAVGGNWVAVGGTGVAVGGTEVASRRHLGRSRRYPGGGWRRRIVGLELRGR